MTDRRRAHPDGRKARGTTVTIPASIEEATSRLGAIERLLTATGWERAAIVAAFVRLNDGPGQPQSITNNGNTLSTVGFADLGITGLRKADTVRLYVQAWLGVQPLVEVTSGRLSPNGFAALGIAGLKSHVTVRLYGPALLDLHARACRIVGGRAR